MAEQAPPVGRIDVVWEGERKFRAGSPGGPTTVIDGGRSAAPSPVENLVGALASCAAIDVLEILAKRRTPAESLQVEIEYTRAPSPPRRLTDVLVRFKVATGSERHHVERAVALSFETYCSVSSSLRPDLPISWEVELLPANGAGVG
jgi:putative redox protein